MHDRHYAGFSASGLRQTSKGYLEAGNPAKLHRKRLLWHRPCTYQYKPAGGGCLSEETTANHVFAQHLRNKLSMRPIPLLAGLRAIAVFLVIFYHFGLPIPGGQGVIIFFVLSGFLITWLFLKEDEKYGRVSLRGFYWRRVLRIFPAFYFYWVIVVAMLLFTNK